MKGETYPAKKNKPIQSVAFIFLRGHSILVERRKQDKAIAPALKSIPGGHVEKGESIEQALVRECREELNVDIIDYSHIGSLVYPSEQKSFHVNYFVVKKWQGAIKSKEAAELYWLPVDTKNVDLWINKLMLQALHHRPDLH